jgi:hypothetical protein
MHMHGTPTVMSYEVGEERDGLPRIKFNFSTRPRQRSRLRLRKYTEPMNNSTSSISSGTATYVLRPNASPPALSPSPTALVPSPARSTSPTISDRGAHFPSGDREWEVLRPIIRELYVTRNLPLRLVAHTMRTEHGLKAR